MIINHNIAALNTYRQLSNNNALQSKSLEKLSSGLRINRAGDDAAGLAISEKMRGQIRGLDQASRNAQDGISMIQTAEGALNETHSILQRMRELAVQAGNNTNTSTDRAEIQKEMNQLTSEINRIGNTTEFNTQKLLDGGTYGTAEASGTHLTGGVAAGPAVQAIYKIDLTGRIASGESLNLTVDGANINLAITNANDTVNGTSVGIMSNTTQTNDADDLVTALNAALTAAGKNTDWIASNDGSDDVIITAVAVGSGGTKDGAAGNGLITNNGSTIVNVGTPAVAETTTGANAVTAAAAAGTVDFGNNILGSGSTITINDQTYQVYDSSKGDAVPSGTGIVAIDTKGMESNEDLIDAIIANGTQPTGITLSKVGTNELKATASATGTGGNAYALSVHTQGGSQDQFDADFQIGANKGQAMQIEVDDMRATALGVSSLAGTSTTVTISGTSYDVVWAATKEVTDGTNNTATEAGLSVASHDDASKAIQVLDAAIGRVSSERSKLGAYQNRLEHTINNLGTSSENLSAAESRIRDVDMAKEMMEFTKDNILSQAATAMLAQANQQPQTVLQLLGR